jgi:hypothetical protein
MISKGQIEIYAAKIAASIEPLVDDLGDAEFSAVFDRVAEIARQRRNSLKVLVKLLRQ